MGIKRDKIEAHMAKNKMLNELQAGFTANGRVTDNLFLLKECTEGSYRGKKPLFVIAVDFQKAFDSIARGKLIEVLMKYRINNKIIDLIADIYTGDKTELYLNNRKHVEIKVTSGIRQGCNGQWVNNTIPAGDLYYHRKVAEREHRL